MNKIISLENLSRYNDNVQTLISEKQDIISDLNDIRSGAALGTTALQEHQDISHLATKSELTESEEAFTTAINELTARINALNTPVVQTAATVITLEPNKYYLHTWSGISTLTITLAPPSNKTIVNTYMLSFKSGPNGTTLSLPDTIMWLNGDIPLIGAYEQCQLSIVDNCAIMSKFI